MPTDQEQFDQAMGAFSQGDYEICIERLNQLLAATPDYFEARLALGMAHCRRGDLATAIAEGHRAETLRPDEQLVHTNLSLFYMKAGDKEAAERHGLKARMASWKQGMTQSPSDDPPTRNLPMSAPKPAAVKLPTKFPDMPWKNKRPIGSGGKSSSGNE